jgi:RNA polymerase sigma-70 factor, ECF subfamily
VLGFSAREVAQSLDTTAASVNSALQRARKTVDEELPDRSQQATLRSLGDERLSGLVQRYVEAWESRNVDLMVAVLAEDVTFAMPPFPHWFSGRDTVITFMVATGKPRLRYVLTRAGGQPAVGWYIRKAPRHVYLPTSIEVLALEGDRVKEVTAFASPSLFPYFGLPEELV